MKKIMMTHLVFVFLCWIAGLATAQVSPTMYTLEDIYYYMVEGTNATEGDHSLEPPSGATAGDIRFKTLKELYEDIHASFGQCDASPGDVAEGKVFFCTNPASWGLQTGTGENFQQPDWYEQYGIDGYGDVVQIESMYVARVTTGLGCAGNTQMSWDDAQTWASNLVWCERDDWRLPCCVECSSPYESTYICQNSHLLDSWQSGYYWSKDYNHTSGYEHYGVAYTLGDGAGGGCANSNGIEKTELHYVRVIRTGE